MMTTCACHWYGLKGHFQIWVESYHMTVPKIRHAILYIQYTKSWLFFDMRRPYVTIQYNLSFNSTQKYSSSTCQSSVLTTSLSGLDLETSFGTNAHFYLKRTSMYPLGVKPGDWRFFLWKQDRPDKTFGEWKPSFNEKEMWKPPFNAKEMVCLCHTYRLAYGSANKDIQTPVDKMLKLYWYQLEICNSLTHAWKTGRSLNDIDIVIGYNNMEFRSKAGGSGHKLYALQWRHNGRDCVSNHQHHDCLLNRLFMRRSKKTSKLSVTGLCTGNSPVTGEFPVQNGQ